MESRAVIPSNRPKEQT